MIHAFPGTSTPREGLFSFPPGCDSRQPGKGARIVHGGPGFGKGSVGLTAKDGSPKVAGSPPEPPPCPLSPATCCLA